MSLADERFRNRDTKVRNASVVKFAGGAATPKASFARKAVPITYTVGAIVAQETAAAMEFKEAAREYASTLLILKARLRKSSPNLINAAFVLHLFSEAPAPVNQDGGAFLTDKSASYLGSIDIFSFRAFSDGATGVGAPTADGPICVELPQGTPAVPKDVRSIFGLLEARGAYDSIAGEVFEVTLEVQQD